MKYTIKDLKKEFNTDAQCVKFVFENRYGKDFVCPACKATGKFYFIESRKRFDCVCGFAVSPLSGTIFHKSSTPLTMWFHAIFLFASSRNGVSAKELERQLGVTYKTAWRLAKQIRILFAQANNPLSGVVEADETYIGGIRKGKRGRGASNKTAVFGIVQRKGAIKAQVVESINIKTIQPIIDSSVVKGASIITDEFNVYNQVKKSGYEHYTIQHGIGEYVRGLVHSNSIEGFWSQLKRSINGTHHSVSPKYLQLYLDEFVWRYSHRGQSLFPLMLATAVMPVSANYERTFS